MNWDTLKLILKRLTEQLGFHRVRSDEYRGPCRRRRRRCCGRRNRKRSFGTRDGRRPAGVAVQHAHHAKV